MTPSGFEPATFWIVAQCLNQPRVPLAADRKVILNAEGSIFTMCCNALVPTESLRIGGPVSQIADCSVTLNVRQKAFGPFILVTYHSVR
jgi:hypothetical protein